MYTDESELTLKDKNIQIPLTFDLTDQSVHKMLLPKEAKVYPYNDGLIPGHAFSVCLRAIILKQ